MPSIDPAHPLSKLLKQDTRYKFDAYVFVFESLNFAHEQLGMGQDQPPDEEGTTKPETKRGKSKKAERHLTGQQLCEALRKYASDQFGLMAKAVLGSWGLRSTSDIGNIVFNLIEIGQMRKTKQDRREDFDNLYDFDEAFVRDFKLVPPPQE
jgi:uncharacterized repeat protein (TIGR04138 family)